MAKRRTNPQREFDSYLTKFRSRYKLRIIVTAIAAVIFSVLTVSLLTAVLKNTLADSNWLYYPARVMLLVLPVILFIAILWKPYQRFKQSAGATELENAVPEFNGRVDTYLDMKRRNVDSPFVGLLAKDASRAAAKAPVKTILPVSEVMGPVFASVAMLALAGWLFTALPLDWRASMKQLWMGWFVSDILPERSIAMTPGDTKIRVGDSLFVTATLDGFESGFADLHVKQSNSDNAAFEKVAMTPEADGSFSFTLYGVSDPIDYYVSAAFTESERATVEVVTPARITSISHKYLYPEWTGTEPASFDDATSIRAVAGTVVEVTFETDKPLQKAAALHDDIEVPATETAENTYTASITVQTDGEYNLIELQDAAQIPLSPTHSITLLEDAKPTVAFSMPGGDWSATAIEEVAVAVEAQDDFSVESVTLNYSVNGAAWEQITLNEENEFEHLFMLEEFYSETGSPLLAGDLISYYAEAADREQTVSTDMMFIDVRPFERSFTQSQQSGGGGGGGGSQQEQEISQRQKEILVSTFNLIRDSKNEGSALIDPADTATLLSDLQTTLADQATKLAQRAESRQLLNADPDVARFIEFMQVAAESMQPSADALTRLSFEEAVAHQQRALQYLKRAESIFNDITINQNNSSGGGGGASQDMQEMYELEMDLAKNQYETPDSVPEESPQEASSDEAFDKLKELAKRQQQLAEAAAQKEEQSEADRWQQEKLRRELEELQKELQQLQRDQQQASNEQGQQSDQQSAEQSGQQSGEQQGQQSQSGGGQSSESQQAMQSLEEAIEELKQVEDNAANMTPEERQQALQNASDKLRRSLEETANERQQELQQQLADASDAVRELNQQQQETSAELREAMKRALEARRENRFESGLDDQQERRLAETKRQMKRDLESIREDLADASKRFAEQAPLTTQRLEQALDELDRTQVAEQIGTTGDMIEEGMAPQAALREERIDNALRNLQTDLFESSSLAAAETGLENESETSIADATRAVQQLRQALAEALAEAGEGSGEQVAELQQLDNSRGEGSGSESDQQGQGEGQGEGESEEADGQGQGNGQGSQQGEGQGQAQGQGQSQQGQNGSSGNSSSQGQLGGNSTWGPNNGSGPESSLPISGGQAQLIEESIRQLQELADTPPSELSEQSLQDLNALNQQLNTGNDPENNRRIEANVRLLLRQLEQLELQIYNDSKEVQVTRSKQRVADPKGFDSQTADYFRRLSEPAGS